MVYTYGKPVKQIIYRMDTVEVPEGVTKL